MTPYAYHLYHTPTEKHYYGIRYSKNCSPSDLWNTYFSSSKIVHSLIKEYGKDSFVVTVRKVFDNIDKAILWETKFLTKINAKDNDKWLNQHNGGKTFIGPYIHNDKTKETISSKITGMKRSEETKEKMRLKALEREKKRRLDGWKMPIEAIQKSLTTKKERIESGLSNPYSEERNKKMAETKSGKKRKYLPNGSYIMVDPQELQ